MAEKVGTLPSMPRVATRQQYRSNIASLSPMEYHKKNNAIPFLDHICTRLAEQCSSLSITETSLLQLVPSVMCSKEIRLSEVIGSFAISFHTGFDPNYEFH